MNDRTVTTSTVTRARRAANAATFDLIRIARDHNAAGDIVRTREAIVASGLPNRRSADAAARLHTRITHNGGTSL